MKTTGSRKESSECRVKPGTEAGFSLVEACIALVVIMVAMLGVFSTLLFAINYNAGNKARSQAGAVMQREIERYRSAKFNSTRTDSYVSPASPGYCLDTGLRDLRGRPKSKCTVIANDGTGLTFTVSSAVDNDPFVPGIQDESYICRTPQGLAIPCAIKEIRIEVQLEAGNPGWQSAMPAIAIFRRVRGN